MSRPSSEHLTHKYPIWQGCTLGEIILTAVAVAIAVLLILLCLGLFIGHLGFLFIAFAPLLYFGTRFLMPRIAKFKQDKPHGYCTTQVRLWLDIKTHGLLPSPFIHRTGYWGITRHINVNPRGHRT